MPAPSVCVVSPPLPPPRVVFPPPLHVLPTVPPTAFFLVIKAVLPWGWGSSSQELDALRVQQGSHKGHLSGMGCSPLSSAAPHAVCEAVKWLPHY